MAVASMLLAAAIGSVAEAKPVETVGFSPNSRSLILAQATTEQAPLGNYAAESTEAVRRVTRLREGAASQRSGVTTNTVGDLLQISLTSYSSRAELAAAAQAEPGTLASVIGNYSHGTVALDGVVYPINVASSYKFGPDYYIHLVSTRPFGASGEDDGFVQGNALGLITLVVPVDGRSGTGTLYTTTGAVIGSEGEVEVLRRGSTARDLVNVARN